jgi:hypothetical protein
MRIKNKTQLSIIGITWGLGFVPMSIYSLLSKTFFFTSKTSFPFLSLPSVFFGDLVVLPILNIYIYNIIRKSKIELLKSKNIGRLLLCFVVSYLCNLFIHLEWVSDKYLGFMDKQYGKLSFGGITHFYFSVFELGYILMFLILLPQFNKNSFKSIGRTFLILSAFLSLSIFDEIFKNSFIFKKPITINVFLGNKPFLFLLLITIIFSIYYTRKFVNLESSSK